MNMRDCCNITFRQKLK